MVPRYEAHRVEEVARDLEAAMGLRRFTDEEGNPTEEIEVQLSRELLLRIYATMVRVRILDEWLLRMQRVGKVALSTPSAGQDAMVGAVVTLREEDWFSPSYRELSAFISRGMSEIAVDAEDGLVVPDIKVGMKGLFQIARGIWELSQRAREGRWS